MSNAAEIEAAKARLHQFYIDGAWVDASGAERSGVVNPATEEGIAEVALGSVEDTDKAVAAARAAFSGWAATAPTERAGKIARLRELVRLPAPEFLTRYRVHEQLLGQPVAWEGGRGTALAVSTDGALEVRTADGTERLHAGEVSLA